MFEFDLQRFDEDAAQAQSADVPEQQTDDEPLPEELNGLPEDIARETLAEWKASQAAEESQSEPQDEQPAPRPQTEESVPYARFKEKVDEANQLKAQLAEYQMRMQQPLPPPKPQAQAEPSRQQMKITPEIAKKINAAIEAEALYMSGDNLNLRKKNKLTRVYSCAKVTIDEYSQSTLKREPKLFRLF